MKWLSKSADEAQVHSIASKFNSYSTVGLKDESRLATTLARLLLMRGIQDGESAQHYLAPTLADLHSPYQLTGMKAAVDRLDRAIERKESILIYGDYDVDGTTAIVILKTAIELSGSCADFYVPQRIRD